MPFADMINMAPDCFRLPTAWAAAPTREGHGTTEARPLRSESGRSRLLVASAGHGARGP